MSVTEVAATRPQRWDVPFGETMRDEDVDALLRMEPFRSINPEDFPSVLPLRGILKNDARINLYQNGDIIVREGDYGNSAFLVMRGKARVILEGLPSEALGRPPAVKKGFFRSLFSMLGNPSLPEIRKELRYTNPLVSSKQDPQTELSETRVFLQDVPRIIESTRSVALQEGDIFGELAALTRTPRTATVVADGEALLLELRWQGLRDLMRRTEALREHIEKLYRENSLRVHLRETPLLSVLPSEQLEAVARATVFETHGDFQWHESFYKQSEESPTDAVAHEPLIVEEGSLCSGLVLVRSGFARLSHRYGHGHRTVAYLGKGQVYGLAEAAASAHGEKRVPMANSLRALGYVDVLRIPQQVLQKHVFPYVPKEFVEEAAAKHVVKCSTENCNVSAGRTGPSQPEIETPLLEYLVEHRFINGQNAMVIDLDRCTRCDDCVRACAATHDNNPRFIRHGHTHGSYMVANACMHCVDPVCMIGCPTGAIGRDTETGIVRINDLTCIGCSTCANSCPYDNIRMAEVRNTEGAIILDDESRQPILKATKCDLCADHAGGPACQRACPHDALVRMDLGNLGELSDLVNR